MLFQKSDAGAQAAWKGFSSQTLYIASRLILDKNDCEYYPEDVEDLVIRKNGIVVEAVQVKNVSDSLTLSSLASTKTSKGGDGFFNRMCSLHTQNPSFHCIKVVYFNALGAELQEIQKGNDDTKKILVKRLKEKHSLSETEATWLIDSAHPTHIRHDLDFKRNYWLEKIQTVIESKGVAIIKGVSGQGKSTLSYRYLIDTYSEGCVFCVRAIATEGQAQNLVAALDGLGKHNKNLIIYILRQKH